VNQQDRSFLTIFTAIMGVLALISVAIFFIAQLVSKVITYQGDDGSRLVASVEKRLAPVGRVVLVGDEGEGAVAAQTADLTGEQIVAQVCAACHQAGVLEAPKIGSKDQWEPRLENGLDTIVANAINGINAMPARGGNPDLSDELVRDATLYMMAQSGLDVSGESAGGDAPAAEAQSEEPEMETAGRGIAGEQGKAIAAEQAAAEAEEPASAGASSGDFEEAKAQYAQSCAACHDTGAANAPKLGDKATWEPRLAQGSDVLVEHAVKGFNAMPPKGGAMHLSDEQIGTIVDYMVQTVE